MKKYISQEVHLIIVIMLILSSCKYDTSKNAEKEKLATIDTINTLMGRITTFANNLRLDSIAPFLSEDSAAVFISGGMHYSKKGFISAMQNVYNSLKVQNLHIIHSQVTVTTPGNAIWISWMKDTYIMKEDKPGEQFLCETWVWQREAAGWKVIHFHESIMDLPGAEKRSLVENALGKLAAELSDRNLVPSDMPEILRNYLKNFSFIYGAALAFAPDEAGSQKHVAAPYVYRAGIEFKQVDLPVAYDYTQSDWYSEPVKTKSPYWCNPYYDDGGGGIVMVTYSIPLYSKSGTLIGVLTSDLELQ